MKYLGLWKAAFVLELYALNLKVRVRLEDW